MGCWEGKRKSWGVGCICKMGGNEEMSEKLRVFNLDSAFMSRHKVFMPWHEVKFFYILPCACRGMDNSCRSMLDSGSFLVLWSCRGMNVSCHSMLLSSF